MRDMDLGLPNFFWDTLDMYRNHWNGFQARTLQYPTWPIDTRGLMSILGSPYVHSAAKFPLYFILDLG